MILRSLLTAPAATAKLGIRRMRARSAQRRKNWPEAVELWRKCLELVPDDRSASAGLIGCLIYAGDLEEASQQAAALIRNFPGDLNGPLALARIAEARGDNARAIGHWRSVLERRPNHLQALIRLGAALLGAADYDEAAACAANLSSFHPGQPYGAILLAQVIQARSSFDEAAPAWERGAQTFGRNVHFLRAYGRALSSAGREDECLQVAERLRGLDIAESWRLRGEVLSRRQPYQDHSAFWKEATDELPDNIDITRKRLHAALWARQLGQAESAFDRLLMLRPLLASDADYLVGLGHAHLELGNTNAARIAVRKYMRAMRLQFAYRTAALRLDRLILSSFPRRAVPVVLSRDTDRFLRLVRRTPLPPTSKAPVEQIAEIENRLVQSGATCLFDTDIDADSCRAFVQIVMDHLENGQPFSFIRLGDGESNALEYETAFIDRFEADAAAREVIWWGRSLDPTTRSHLARDVRTAIDRADGLGIPLRARLLRDVRLDRGSPLSANRSGRGLIAILRMLERDAMEHTYSGRLLTSAHIHQDLERWNLYPDLFERAKEVVLISCHPGLPQKMQERFGVNIAKHIVMPPGDAMLEMQGRALPENELPPQSLQRASAELDEWPRGRLVLVGAGYAGKVVIDVARERGGIALDLGSIFDHWMGLNTRSYQDLA
jgi:tetratricopeptide (TPR) repeat protein